MNWFQNSFVDIKKKKRKHHKIYIPWYTRDEELYEEEEGQEDSWVSYIRRNLPHPVGAESPFPDSSWSYASHDSVYDKDEDDEGETKGDSVIYDEVTDALYRNPQIDASGIKLIVLNGIVCLFGSARTDQEKKEAEKTVRELPGVWSVRNEIKIEEV